MSSTVIDLSGNRMSTKKVLFYITSHEFFDYTSCYVSLDESDLIAIWCKCSRVGSNILKKITYQEFINPPPKYHIFFLLISRFLTHFSFSYSFPVFLLISGLHYIIYFTIYNTIYCI